MQDVNKKLVWSTAILALLLIAVLGFFAGMYFGGKNRPEVPVVPDTTQTDNGSNKIRRSFCGRSFRQNPTPGPVNGTSAVY